MTAYLSPIFQSNQVSDNGQFLIGGLIWSYAAGSSTLQNSYQDSGGAVNWPNPIVLNSRGETGGAIWLPAGLPARLVLETAPPVGNTHGTVITDIDNIYGINDPAQAALTANLIWNPFNFSTFGYTSATSFWVTGDYRSLFANFKRLKSTNAGGTVYSSIVSATYSAGVTTVTVTNDSGALDSGISALWYSSIIPNASPSRFDKVNLNEIDSDGNLIVNNAGWSTSFSDVVNAESGNRLWNNNNCPGSGSSARYGFYNGIFVYRGKVTVACPNGASSASQFIAFSPIFPSTCLAVIASKGALVNILSTAPLFANVASFGNTGFTINLGLYAGTFGASATCDIHFVAYGY